MNEKLNIRASDWIKKNFEYESIIDQLKLLYQNPKMKIKPLELS